MKEMKIYSLFIVKGPGSGLLFRDYFYYYPFRYVTLSKEQHEYFEMFLKERKCIYEIKYGELYNLESTNKTMVETKENDDATNEVINGKQSRRRKRSNGDNEKRPPKRRSGRRAVEVPEEEKGEE